jgi:hypothetical protein
VWNARVVVARLLHVRVLDSLIEGRGAGHVSFLSAFIVSADAGTPEMNSGSLHRYLAEAVWYPSALLPSRKLRWTDGGVTVSPGPAELPDTAGRQSPCRPALLQRCHATAPAHRVGEVGR